MAWDQVRFEVFRGTFASWQTLFSDAAAFASQLGRDRVISISHSEDQNEGVVTVWYWADEGPRDRDAVTWTPEGQEPQ